MPSRTETLTHVLSIVDTLTETFFLWVRNFWYLVALVLVIGTPGLVCAHFFEAPLPPHPSQLVALCEFISLFLWLLLDSARAAAILGLLRRESLGKTFINA